MVKIIAVFNYKGGVAKTTTTISLGTKIAMNKKKVILVDADPQCNLTSFFTKTNDEQADDDEANGDEAMSNGEDGNESNDETTPGTSAAAAKRIQIVRNEGPIKLESIEVNGRLRKNLAIPILQDPIREETDEDEHLLIQPEQNYDLYSMLRPIFGGTFNSNQEENYSLVHLKDYYPKHDFMENIHLVPGSVFISNFEEQLTDSSNELAMRFRGCFRRLLLKLATSYQADYVIVDFSPSSGNMNKIFIMSCDYILPVAKADEFSCSSAQALMFNILDNWFEFGDRMRQIDQRTFSRFDRNPPDLEQFRFNTANPGILPFFVTSYRLYTFRKKSMKIGLNVKNGKRKPMPPIQNAGKPPKAACSKDCSYWLRQLKTIVNDQRISDKVFGRMISFNNDLVIPIIPMLGRLVNLSSQKSIPLPALVANQNKDDKKKMALVNARLQRFFVALEKLPGSN